MIRSMSDWEEGYAAGYEGGVSEALDQELALRSELENVEMTLEVNRKGERYIVYGGEYAIGLCRDFPWLTRLLDYR